MSTDVQFAELIADDEITAIDGHKLPDTRTVEGTRREDGGLRLVRPGPVLSPIEWWIYPSTGDTFTVRRHRPATHPAVAALDEPAPPAPALNVEPTDANLARLATRVPRIRSDVRGLGGFPVRHQLARPLVTDPQVGDVVLVPLGDYYRAAVVTKVGPKRLRVSYTTPHAVARAANGSWPSLIVTNPYVTRTAAYVVRADESWWTR